MEISKLFGKSSKGRRKRMYVYLLDDNINSFDYVIKCLMTTCGQNYYQACQCALLTHQNGICEVDNGFHEEMLYVYMRLLKLGLKAQIKTKKL